MCRSSREMERAVQAVALPVVTTRLGSKALGARNCGDPFQKPEGDSQCSSK